MDLFSGAFNLPSNASAEGTSTPRSTTDVPAWTTDCNLTDNGTRAKPQPPLLTNETTMEDYQSIVDINQLEKESAVGDRCPCVPCCHPPLAWVAKWCIRDLGERGRSSILDSKALLLPPVQIIHSLLESYFLYVNCFTPCVSEWDTYRLLNNGSSEQRPMSLALLNAMMFTATGVSDQPNLGILLILFQFISVDQAQKAGFADICQMRNTFYARAKVIPPRCHQTFFARPTDRILTDLL